MEDHIEIRVLGPGDMAVLENIADDVFDHKVQPAAAREFLEDPRHHLVVALEDGLVVGFASGVHYVHPDKEAELWINEVGVADSHQGRGIAKRIMRRLLEVGRKLGCREAWVLTDPDNVAAKSLYTSAGGEEASTPAVLFTFTLNTPDEPMP